MIFAIAPLSFPVSSVSSVSSVSHDDRFFCWIVTDPKTKTKKVVVGMDVASSEFLMPDGRYDLDFKNKGGDQQLTGEELGQLYKDLAAKYPIVSIEDPFDQDDWANYAPFTAAVGDSVQVVGDDLLVTNPSRIVEAGEKKACNALLLKVCV